MIMMLEMLRTKSQCLSSISQSRNICVLKCSKKLTNNWKIIYKSGFNLHTNNNLSQ